MKGILLVALITIHTVNYHIKTHGFPMFLIYPDCAHSLKKNISSRTGFLGVVTKVKATDAQIYTAVSGETGERAKGFLPNKKQIN
jgi:hypothetical protein